MQHILYSVDFKRVKFIVKSKDGSGSLVKRVINTHMADGSWVNGSKVILSDQRPYHTSQ